MRRAPRRLFRRNRCWWVGRCGGGYAGLGRWPPGFSSSRSGWAAANRSRCTRLKGRSACCGSGRPGPARCPVQPVSARTMLPPAPGVLWRKMAPLRTCGWLVAGGRCVEFQGAGSCGAVEQPSKWWAALEFRLAVVVVNAPLCKWVGESNHGTRRSGSSCLRPFCGWGCWPVALGPAGLGVGRRVLGLFQGSRIRAQVLFTSWSSRGSAGDALAVGLAPQCVLVALSSGRVAGSGGWPGVPPAGLGRFLQSVAGWLVSVAFPWPWEGARYSRGRGAGGNRGAWGLWGWGGLAGSRVRPFGWVGPGPALRRRRLADRQAVVLVNRPELQALRFTGWVSASWRLGLVGLSQLGPVVGATSRRWLGRRRHPGRLAPGL